MSEITRTILVHLANHDADEYTAVFPSDDDSVAVEVNEDTGYLTVYGKNETAIYRPGTWDVVVVETAEGVEKGSDVQFYGQS